ncbi:dihydroneopterin aldolase [Luteimonas sp. e5]
MSDRVFLHGLALEVLIGHYREERAAPQPLRLDIEFDCDLGAAGESDALADAIDYAAVATRVREWVADTRFELLEALLHGLAAMLRTEFPARAVRLRVHKPLAAQALGCADVGIEIRREGSTT